MLKQQLMRSAYFQRALIICLGLSLLLRVLMPVGFMPDMGALSRGVFQITICSANGAQNILLDQNHRKIDPNKQTPQHQGQKEAPCAFGALPVFTPPASIIIIALALVAIGLLLRQDFGRSVNAFVNIAARSRAPPILQH